MMRPAVHSVPGAVLLELLLALALLVSIGSFVLRASSAAVESVQHQRREQQAIDLARSVLAALDASLVSAEEVRTGWPRAFGSHERFSEAIDAAREDGGPDWRLEVQTQPSEHPGLIVVTVTVRDGDVATSAHDATNANATDPRRASVTLTQLMALHERTNDAAADVRSGGRE